jgi:hypothetical protein
MRLFYALSAALGLLVTIADTTNAFQQLAPPTQKCYLEIDEAYCSWYCKCFGRDIDPRTHVIPVGRAVQGHPEAGVLWEKMIVGILEGPELGFRLTTHERNLYHGIIDGELVFVCHQVDDFAIASKSQDTAEKLIKVVNSHATTDSQGIGVKTVHGVSSRYNGIDVHQTQDYIKLSCETYIKRVLQTHDWEAPSPRESDRHDLVPMSSDNAAQLLTNKGHMEGTAKHRKLEEAMCFSYCQVLGELIYAYVICRLDIGFAVTLLARFAQFPAKEHYLALKHVVRYLHQTMH